MVYSGPITRGRSRFGDPSGILVAYDVPSDDILDNPDKYSSLKAAGCFLALACGIATFIGSLFGLNYYLYTRYPINPPSQTALENPRTSDSKSLSTRVSQ